MVALGEFRTKIAMTFSSVRFSLWSEELTMVNTSLNTSASATSDIHISALVLMLWLLTATDDASVALMIMEIMMTAGTIC